MDLADICEDGKCVLALCIAEITLKSIEEKNEDLDYCRKSVDLCWEWLEDRTISKWQICERISNDNRAIADIVLETEDINLANKYGTILICVSYTAWQAYNYEEDYCYPQDLECVDDEYLLNLINDLIKEKFILYNTYESLLRYIKGNYCINDKKVTKRDIIGNLNNLY